MDVKEAAVEYLTEVEPQTYQDVVPPGYQRTEVGVIPEDWEVEELRELIKSLDSGVSVNSDDGSQLLNSEKFILKTSCVFSGKFFPEESKPIARRDLARAKLNPVADSIVISRMNTPLLVGECGYVENNYLHLYVPDRLWLARSNPSSCHSTRWLAHQLSSSITARDIKDESTGTSGSMKNISKPAFLSVRIPLPPLEAEQRAIAEALSDTDALIAALQRLIAKKRAIKQGTMQALLTGRQRLPGFTGEWLKVPFGKVATPRKERVDPRVTGPYNFCVELEHIQSGTGTRSGHVVATPQSSLKTVFYVDDVLFGKLRAYLRKYWLADQRGVCSTEIWSLTTMGSLKSSRLLFHIVQTSDFIEVASVGYGTHMPRSDWKLVEEHEVTIPCDSEEQTAIATVLSDMDAEIEALEARLAKTRQLKAGMMQQLLTGRIRLPLEAAA